MSAEGEGNHTLKMFGANFEKKTVVELKSMLMARNLETSGRKAELIARLESAVTSDVIAVDPVGSQVVGAATISAREDPPEWVKALQRQKEAMAGTGRESHARTLWPNVENLSFRTRQRQLVPSETCLAGLKQPPATITPSQMPVKKVGDCVMINFNFFQFQLLIQRVLMLQWHLLKSLS